MCVRVTHCRLQLRVRRVRVEQRRNEGGQGGHNCRGAESLRGRRKAPTMSQVLFSTAHLLPKDLRFEHRDAKLVSCPGRNLTSFRL